MATIDATHFVDPSRFRPIVNHAALWMLRDLKFSQNDEVALNGERLLITDPTYIADVYQSKDDPNAQYVREHGVIVHDFGGDQSCPVWWKDPYLVLPLSSIYDGSPQLPTGVNQVADNVSCDSGSFVFLPVRDDMPAKLGVKIDFEVHRGFAALVSLPAGRYRVVYEQYPFEEKWSEASCRNIVLHRVS